MECPASTCCVNKSCVLFNLPSLIWQIRTVELEPQSAGRSLSCVQFTNAAIADNSKKWSVHMIIEKMCAKCRREACDPHAVLPQFICRCSDLNPKAVVALQVDNKDCFMQLFVAIPHFKELFSKLCLPMLHIDGAHSKSTL
jgi:hypothetical protein